LGVVWTTWRKELASYFWSPVGWVIAVLFHLFRGIELASLVRAMQNYPVDQEQFAVAYLSRLSSFILMVLVPPILTMRTFAEERRTGSIEVLMTAPVRDAEIVAGKFLTATTFFLVLLLPTVVVLWILSGDGWLGAGVAWGPVLSGYLGIVLVGCLLLAIGCFTSSLTDNQLLAVLVAILLAAVLLFAPGIVAPYLAERGLAAAAPEGFERTLRALQESVLLPLLHQIDVFDHLRNWFFRGLIHTGHVVFYVSGTLFFLFLTTRALEVRRWR